MATVLYLIYDPDGKVSAIPIVGRTSRDRHLYFYRACQIKGSTYRGPVYCYDMLDDRWALAHMLMFGELERIARSHPLMASSYT